MEGYELGYYTFDTLPALEVLNVETTWDTSVCVKKYSDTDYLLELPIDNDTLSRLQQNDEFCANILTQIEKGNIIMGQLYVVQDKICHRWQ